MHLRTLSLTSVIVCTIAPVPARAQSDTMYYSDDPQWPYLSCGEYRANFHPSGRFNVWSDTQANTSYFGSYFTGIVWKSDAANENGRHVDGLLLDLHGNFYLRIDGNACGFKSGVWNNTQVVRCPAPHDDPSTKKRLRLGGDGVLVLEYQEGPAWRQYAVVSDRGQTDLEWQRAHDD